MNKTLFWRLVGLDTALMILIFDQLTKFLIMTGIFEEMYNDTVPGIGEWLFSKAERITHPPIKITEFFNVVIVWNPGVSFGMLQTDGSVVGLILSGFAVLVSIGFLVWLWREPRAMVTLPVGLIVGGALGNVWDRLRFGAVLDFLDVHVAGRHWPAFNLADSAITIGVILLLVDQLFLSKRSHGDVTHETL